jgi:hypothetical protein
LKAFRREDRIVGAISCVRISIANAPANAKNVKELTRYMIPIFL